MESEDLKYLKKHYGDRFAKLCRELFPTLLETPGLLKQIICKYFDKSSTLYEDIKEIKYPFRAFVLSKVGIKSDFVPTNKTPEQLFDEAGYVLYPECQTEADIQQFKKYYAKGEALCTFYGGRLEYCRVWFAVKKNVDQIRRQDFLNPDREDEYGTSVLSIQFSKSQPQVLSIKNRYNHTVKNPDATFGNFLDNIAVGLSNAFEVCKNININKSAFKFFDIDGYAKSLDGKFYKVNCSFYSQNVYICENNVVLYGGKEMRFDGKNCLLADNFLIDFQSKKIVDIAPDKKDSGFLASLGEIDDIKLVIEQGQKFVRVFSKNGSQTQLKIGRGNTIIQYKNDQITQIGDNFLPYSKNIETFEAKNLKVVGDNFLPFAPYIKRIDLPNLEKAGSSFLMGDEGLEEICLPKLSIVKNNFCRNAIKILSVCLPSLKIVGDFFLAYARELKKIELPKIEKIGNMALIFNKIEQIDLKNCKYIGAAFFSNNNTLKKISLPKLKKTVSAFLCSNNQIKSIELPSATQIDDGFLSNNTVIESVIAPNVVKVGHYFLRSAKKISHLELPNCKQIGDGFLLADIGTTSICLESVETIGQNFMSNNIMLESFYAPNLQSFGKDFLAVNSHYCNYAQTDQKACEQPQKRKRPICLLDGGDDLFDLMI